MKLLAFDLGSNMAMAHNCHGSPQVFSKVFEGDRIERAADTQAWLGGLRYTQDLDAVIFERPFARGRAATRALWGIAGLIEATFGHVCAVVDIDPTSLKKWATGNARASKQEMIQAANALGYDGDNEHESDAWLLLHYAEANNVVET